MTSDQIMLRVGELVELAKKDTAMTMLANRSSSAFDVRAAGKASDAFFEAFEKFEKEVAEPLAESPLEKCKRDGRERDVLKAARDWNVAVVNAGSDKLVPLEEAALLAAARDLGPKRG